MGGLEVVEERFIMLACGEDFGGKALVSGGFGGGLPLGVGGFAFGWFSPNIFPAPHEKPPRTSKTPKATIKTNHPLPLFFKIFHRYCHWQVV